MLQIAKWDLLQYDQCYLSKDMKGMNAVVDEHLVTSGMLNSALNAQKSKI